MHMAFVKDKTGAAQTAANASATVIAAFADSFKSFDDAVVAFNELRTQVFEELAVVVDADNAVFAANDNGGTSKPAKSSGSSSRSGKTFARKSGSNGGSIGLKDALDMELNFGAFGGETLETVLNLSADDADEQYGYGDGERSGRDYVTWLASDKNKNEYVQKRARVIADEEGIDY